ncbi:hypothetical protein KCU67_g4169, partial [Aureobasidium melanogenum]
MPFQGLLSKVRERSMETEDPEPDQEWMQALGGSSVYSRLNPEVGLEDMKPYEWDSTTFEANSWSSRETLSSIVDRNAEIQDFTVSIVTHIASMEEQVGLLSSHKRQAVSMSDPLIHVRELLRDTLVNETTKSVEEDTVPSTVHHSSRSTVGPRSEDAPSNDTWPTDYSSTGPQLGNKVDPPPEITPTDKDDGGMQSIPEIETDIQSLNESITFSNVIPAAAREVAKAFTRASGTAEIYEEGLKRRNSSFFVENHRVLLKLFYLGALQEAQIPSEHMVLRFLRSRSARERISDWIVDMQRLSEDEDDISDDINHHSVREIERYLAQVDKSSTILQWAKTQEPDRGNDDSSPLAAGHAQHEQSVFKDIGSYSLMNIQSGLQDNEEPEASDEGEEDSELRTEQIPPLVAAAKFLTDGQTFRVYKNNLERFVRGKLLAPFEFKAALEKDEVDEAIRLLEEEPEVVTQPACPFEWIREPLDMGFTPKEIVDLIIEERELGPWICYEPPSLEEYTVDSAFHRDGCFHNSIQQGLKIHQQQSLKRETINRRVAELCGLGGVVPHCTARSLWEGSVTFTDTSARVSYGARQTSTRNLEEDMEIAKCCLKALVRITTLVAWLQRNDLICDRFLLLKQRTTAATVEVTQIPFHVLAGLRRALEDVIASSTAHHCNAARRSSLTILKLVSQECEDLDAETSLEETVLCEAIDACALAVQVLCVGMLAFSTAFVGEIRPFFLQYGLSRIDLCGAQGPLSERLSLSLGPKELSCMGDMLGNNVLAFARQKGVPDQTRHDLLTSVEDLFELWGPGHVVIDKSAPFDHNICGVEVGGGSIYQPSKDSSMFHWAQGTPKHTDFLARHACISCHDAILVGSSSQINQDCPLNLSLRNKPVAERTIGRLKTTSKHHCLGTFGKYWTMREIQCGAQAGQYAVVGVNATWVKSDSQTLKMQIVSKDLDLDFLEAPWGLIISICTGVAKRVPLREVIAETVVPIIAAWAKKPDEWEQLFTDGDGIVEELSKSTFRKWYEALQKAQREAAIEILEYVLSQICLTGFNNTGELVVACPTYGDANSCLHVRYEKNIWTTILKDSEDCATFACFTAKCIQTEDRKCRNSDQPTWEDEIPVLVTSVCQYQWLKTNGWSKILQKKSLQYGKNYWMGCIGDERRFIASQYPHPSGPTLLKISKSMCPDFFFRRAWGKPDRMRAHYIKLQERRMIDEEAAEDVFVLDSTR